jgi:Fuc2NAc and GlcNAc transferase
MSAALATLLLSATLCGLYLRLARRLQWVDRPNERSSHHRPTPHGGGAPLLVAFTLGLALAAIWNGPWAESYRVLWAGALFLMLLGVADDLRGLSVSLRITLYGLSCLVLSIWLSRSAGPGSSLPLVVVIWTLILLWSLNLYNFMDGIDGIAATQCVLACVSAALLAWVGKGEGAYALFCLLLAAAHLGFLLWNWPPARLFLGDAGSVPTGYLIAALAMVGWIQGQLDPLCWLVLMAVFVTDATWTLLWRMASGQPFTRPHRLHAYQRLSRHWGSHLAVDLLLILVNAVWLFPLALAVQTWPDLGILLVILAYLPPVWGMAKVRQLT